MPTNICFVFTNQRLKAAHDCFIRKLCTREHALRSSTISKVLFKVLLSQIIAAAHTHAHTLHFVYKHLEKRYHRERVHPCVSSRQSPIMVSRGHTESRTLAHHRANGENHPASCLRSTQWKTESLKYGDARAHIDPEPTGRKQAIKRFSRA